MRVKLEALYKDSGLIKIPERYKKAPHLIGKIVALSMRTEDFLALGVNLQAGDRILVTPLGGRELPGDTWMYPITLKRKDERGRKYRDSGVLAIVADTVNLSAHSQAIERCQFCGDARSGAKQNVILWEGTCPRCGKNNQGEVPDKSVKLTEADMALCPQK